MNEELIDEIRRRVLGVVQPAEMILFGSAVSGQMTGDSDIDLLVLERAPVNVRAESVRIGNALRGLGFAFDVIVMAKSRFEETKNVVGGIAYPANKYGRVIYEAG